MQETYMSLLAKLKADQREKKDIDFINYLMYKYSAKEPLFEKISDYKIYFIKEDIEQLEEILEPTDKKMEQK